MKNLLKLAMQEDKTVSIFWRSFAREIPANFPVGREFGRRDRSAPDWVPRHTVWIPEKSCLAPKRIIPATLSQRALPPMRSSDSPTGSGMTTRKARLVASYEVFSGAVLIESVALAFAEGQS